MTGSEVLLSADSLNKTFGGVQAVSQVSLQVKAGQVLGLIGPNGAGKSTIVNLVAGFARPDAGTVTLLGKDITRTLPHERARRGLIRTFQKNRTFPLLPGTDVIMAALSPSARDSFLSWLITPWRARRHRQALVAEAERHLSASNLGAALDPTPVGVLAPAVNRLLGFTVSMAARPQVLVLDEPAAGLSRSERDLLSERIGGIATTGVGVLVIEHDVDFIMRTCDRIVAVDHGVVIADGTPDDVRSDPAVRQAYLGDADVAS